MSKLAIVGRPEKKLLSVEPLGDMVLVDERRAEQGSGLVLPDQVSDATKSVICTYHVLAVGPDCKRVKGGERIILNTKAFHALIAPGDPRVLLHEDDILAVVK